MGRAPKPGELIGRSKIALPTESRLPIGLHSVVYPRLNRACVKAVVVVMAAAVLAAVAYVGDESLTCTAGPSCQENTTAGVSGTDVARY